jgi:hypothetical protein
MAEEVVAPTEEQSPAPVAAEQPAVATAPDEDVATWKKRLAGKDQALTATQKELASIREEAEQLRKYKAEVEFANMSELEKATTRAKQLESELQAAREDAERETLARKHPLYAQFANETQGLSASAQAEAFEKFVTSVAKDKTVDSYVDTNAPRKVAPPAAAKKNSADIAAELKALGNPYYDGN